MLPGMMALAGAAANSQNGAGTLSFVTSGTSTTNTIAVPASSQAGDLAVVFDGAFNINSASITSVTPSGWTTAVDAYSGFGGSSGGRMKVDYKVLEMGDLSTSPGFSNDVDRKIILIFRPSGTINSVVSSTWNSQQTDGDPSEQTISAFGVASPLIVLAWVGAGEAVSSGPAFTDSPALTEVALDQSNFSIRTGYTIYNSAPANHTVDVGDSGFNGLQSGYLQVS